MLRFGYFVEAFWMRSVALWCLELVLVTSWVRSHCILSAFLLRLVAFCLCPVDVLVTFWAEPRPQWIRFGHILVTFGSPLGHLLVTFWSCFVTPKTPSAARKRYENVNRNSFDYTFWLSFAHLLFSGPFVAQTLRRAQTPRVRHFFASWCPHFQGFLPNLLRCLSVGMVVSTFSCVLRSRMASKLAFSCGLLFWLFWLFFCLWCFLLCCKNVFNCLEASAQNPFGRQVLVIANLGVWYESGFNHMGGFLGQTKVCSLCRICRKKKKNSFVKWCFWRTPKWYFVFLACFCFMLLSELFPMPSLKQIKKIVAFVFEFQVRCASQIWCFFRL